MEYWYSSWNPGKRRLRFFSTIVLKRWSCVVSGWGCRQRRRGVDGRVEDEVAIVMGGFAQDVGPEGALGELRRRSRGVG